MIKRTILLFIITTVLFSCSCNKNHTDILPFNSNNLSDKENNDIMKKPNNVITQNPIIGFFHNKKNVGDKDYYKVYFSLKETSYKIIQTAVPGIDSKISFYSPSQNRLFYIDSSGKGEAEKLCEYYPTTDYIIMLVEAKIGYNEKVPYVIDFIPKKSTGIDEIEPNNDKENAIIVRLDELKKGLISPKGDIDYYKIIFNDDKIYDFSIKLETLSNLDINFTLYNEKIKKVKNINSFSWGGEEFYPFLCSNKGEYYIKISGNIKPYDRKDPIYYLNIKENINDQHDKNTYYEREYNDTHDMATELINSSIVVGAFFPQNDADWFKFDLFKKPISVDISLSRIRGINPIIELYDKKLKKIKIVDDNKLDSGENASFKNLLKGRYYVRLFSKKKSLLAYTFFFNIRYI